MIDTPQIVKTEAAITAVIHLVVPRIEMQKVFGPAVHDLMVALAKQRLKPASRIFAHHLRRPTAESFDFEVGVVVAHAPETDGRVHASMLHAGEVARTLYRGPYEGLPAGWGELRSWLEASGRKMGDQLLEVYRKGPADSADPTTWETQLNQTLA